MILTIHAGHEHDRVALACQLKTCNLYGKKHHYRNAGMRKLNKTCTTQSKRGKCSKHATISTTWMYNVYTKRYLHTHTNRAFGSAYLSLHPSSLSTKTRVKSMFPLDPITISSFVGLPSPLLVSPKRDVKLTPLALNEMTPFTSL